MKKLLMGSIAFSAVFASPVSAATFVGDTFEGSYRHPNLQRTTIQGGAQVVSPTAQFTFPTGRINPTARISASNVLITFEGDGRYNPAEFNGISLQNLSRSDIAGFVLDPSSTVVGFDQSRLSFTSDSLLFNFEGLRIQSTDQVSANVSFISSAVPEPASWGMMLLGLGVIGASFRRREKAKLRVSFA